MSTENRRDVSSRKVPFFQNLAKKLVKLGLTPNQVSVASSVFSILAGFFIFQSSFLEGTSKIIFVVLSIVGIQLRLICNLLDGLMAVEGGLKTASGELFNDVPDRISDAAILVAAGYASIGWMGWLATVLAILTAYVRTLGASMTGKHDFSGPMAKQHRMFLITLGCIGTIFNQHAFALALLIIIVGAFLTCVNRLKKIYNVLEKK